MSKLEFNKKLNESVTGEYLKSFDKLIKFNNTKRNGEFKDLMMNYLGEVIFVSGNYYLDSDDDIVIDELDFDYDYHFNELQLAEIKKQVEWIIHEYLKRRKDDI